MGTIRKSRRLNETQELELTEKRLHLLNIFKSIADKYNVKWFMNWGTLLGLTRDNKFLPHDSDIDISIFPQTISIGFYNEYLNHPELSTAWGKKSEFYKYLRGDINEISYSIGISSSLCFPNEKDNLVRVGKIGAWIDANFIFEYKGNTILKWKGKFFKCPPVNSFKTVDFYDIKVPVPEFPEEHLKNIYTDTWNQRILNWGTTKYGPEYWLTEEETNEVNLIKFKWAR